jgi:hypothetical protein
MRPAVTTTTGPPQSDWKSPSAAQQAHGRVLVRYRGLE